MNVIGLQASSVEFWSRTGVPDYLRHGAHGLRRQRPVLVNNWIANAKNARILELKKAPIPVEPQGKIGGVLFLEGRIPSPAPWWMAIRRCRCPRRRQSGPTTRPSATTTSHWLISATGRTSSTSGSSAPMARWWRRRPRSSTRCCGWPWWPSSRRAASFFPSASVPTCSWMRHNPTRPPTSTRRSSCPLITRSWTRRRSA